MKNIRTTFSIAVVLIMLMSLSSCKKVVTSLFPGINARVPDVSVTVPPILIAPQAEIPLGSYTAAFNLDSVVRANTNDVFNADDISSVKIKSITISVQNSDNFNNLSNFDYARLTISSNSNAEETAIATIHFPQEATSTITVTPENSPEIRSYLNGNQLSYNVYGKMRRGTTKSMNVVVSVTLRIE